MANPHPRTDHLKSARREPGPGRTKGSKNKLTRAMVEKELRHIAFVTARDLFTRTKKHSRAWRLKNVDEMPESLQRALASVKVKTENLTAGDDVQDTTVEVKLIDKVRALELCARALGMLKDVVQVEGLDDRKARLRAALAVPPTKIDE